MKIPILFTIPNFITAGSGRVMMNIIERLDQSIFSPAVCVLRKGGKMDREVEQMGIPFIEANFIIPALPRATFPLRAWRAAQTFRPYHFALWHSWHYIDDYTEPVIARLAGARAWMYTKKNMCWESNGWLLRSYLATHIAVDNDDMPHTFFNRPGLRNKITVIHHGIPTDQFAPNIPKSLEMRKKLNIPQDALVIGCVANLTLRKGHHTLLQALAQIPNVYLMTIGRVLEPDYAERLQKMIPELGLQERAFLLGHVDDVPAFLSEIDIFVLPTGNIGGLEGCPVALVEAMSSGRACIASDIPGSHDLIEHGKSGLLFPPDDAAQLATAIRFFVENPEARASFGNKARERILQNFSIQHEVAKYEKLYKQILGS